jgi:hypothetical protein
MPLADPNNCWPYLLQMFADALAHSAAFQSMSRSANATAATAKIFGKRLQFARNGRHYTREEFEELFGYGQVFGDPNAPYGKHLSAGKNCYLPHGTTCIILARIVTDLDSDRADDSTGLTEVHDRDSQNFFGTIGDQIISWLNDNGGPCPLSGFEVTLDDETPAVHQGTEGSWQGCELTFPWGRG